ncbi:MAG: tetratricopeptide repeat protein [Chitinispirillales bacterium]|jgi:tetratricopeptide (TPR) repeat protein|nr:tetratricopeptide repeat protein [Chitinispirillales bacterium]
MKPIIEILKKLGLNESEAKFVANVVVATSIICALGIGGFWAYTTYYLNADKPAVSSGFAGEKDSDIISKEVTHLDLESHEFTAQRYLHAGRPDKALPHLRRIVAITKDEQAASNALYYMVRAQLEVGDFGYALENANILLAKADDSLAQSLMVSKAIALYNLMEYDESSKTLRDALDRNPNNAEALCFMGEMEAAAEKRSPTAERFFRRAIEADSNYLEAKYQFARYLENNGDYKNARALLLQVLTKDPLNVRAHARLGMIYYYELDSDLALKSYQTALALNPYDYNTHYNLGELYRTLLNDNENALKEFVLALENNPNHSEASYKAGLVCVENEMFKEAIRYFELSLDGNRKNIRRLLQLAAAYERIGDKSTAVAVYKEVTDIDPLHSIAIQKIKFLESEE